MLLLEPGTGEGLEIPLTFPVFHDDELIEWGDAALAEQFFEVWSAAHREALPLQRGQCVGYRVPVFLAGQDVAENLELGDLDVYWTICGQLRQGVRGFPPGSSINQIARD